MPERFPITPKGVLKLKDELARLKEERPKISRDIGVAREHGDLSENAEYQEAREMQAAVEERIQKLESILKNAKIVRVGKSDTVSMGSTVAVQKLGADDKHTYTIVGAEEADILSGKVSYHSPLGAALLGKKKGDEFSSHTPKGTQKYKILKVE